jgi:hypothetical protein
MLSDFSSTTATTSPLQSLSVPRMRQAHLAECPETENFPTRSRDGLFSPLNAFDSIPLLPSELRLCLVIL